jgi:DNA-binding NarL/FixJ family response regulator
MTTQILIADSSSLTVIGAETILKARPDTIILKAQCASELIDLARTHPPDILLMGDLLDPLIDTLALIERLRATAPCVRIIVMGTLTDGRLIQDLFALRVSGYLAVGDDLSACLLTAVDTVLRERPYLSPSANSEYLILMQTGDRDWKLDSEARAVLRLLAQGCTVGTIAAQLRVKPRRVYWVREKLRYRFGATTNEHLISRAAAEGFSSFPD